MQRSSATPRPDAVPPPGAGAAPVPASLVRLFERPAPEVAVSLSRPEGLAAWRDTLTPGRVLVAALLTPLLFVAYRGAIDGTPPSSPGWLALLVGVAALGALALSTYVPQRRSAAVASPCGAISGIWVLFAGMALDAPADPLNGVVALAAVTVALVQRLRGGRACGRPAR